MLGISFVVGIAIPQGFLTAGAAQNDGWLVLFLPQPCEQELTVPAAATFKSRTSSYGDVE